MKEKEEIMDRSDTFFLNKEKELDIFYKNLEELLTDLNLDTAFEHKPSKQVPNKKKIGPTITAKHHFDPYAALEITIKVKVGAPHLYETRNKELSKVAISYKAELTIETPKDKKIQRSEPYNKIFSLFYKKIYKKTAIEGYKDYTKKLMFKIINKARELYDLPDTLK